MKSLDLYYYYNSSRTPIVCKQIREARPDDRQSTSTKRQRLHELAKKTIPLKSVVLVALLAYEEPSNSGNMWFMMSLQACILALVTDIFSAVTLINLTTTVPVSWHCCVACFSGVCATLVPYFLLVSMDKASAYVILAVPLPVAVVALVNCVWAPAGAGELDDALDHVFDVSSAVTNVAAGGGLTGTIFGYSLMTSQQPETGHALGFLLLFTISLGVYLMLLATVRRPKALTCHAERLVYILLALLAATALVAAVEFVGWWLACAVASIDAVEAAVSVVLAKAVHGTAATARDEVDAAGRQNEQRLTSIVIATVLFTLVMQLHSQKAGDNLGKYEVLRMLLYLAAFLWSFNRMVLFHEESLAGGGARVWVWLTVQLVRTMVVVLAVLDHVHYNYY